MKMRCVLGHAVLPEHRANAVTATSIGPSSHEKAESSSAVTDACNVEPTSNNRQQRSQGLVSLRINKQIAFLK